MSSYFATSDRVLDMGLLDIGATGGASERVFAPGKPIDVKRLVMVVTAVQATATDTVTVGVRNVDNTSSTTIGTFTYPTGGALNTVYKIDIAGVNPTAVTPSGEASQPSTVTTGRVLGYQTNQPGVIEVNVGQEFFVSSTSAGTVGTAELYVEYEEMGNNPDRFNATALTFTYS